MNLRAILLALAVGLVASGCATKPSGETRNGTGKSANIGSTNTTQNTIAGLVNFCVEVKLAEIRPGLDLTSGQEAEIRKILIRPFETLSNFIQGGSSPKELNESNKQLINYRAQIKPVLTPQQLAAYQARLTQRAQKMAATELKQLQTPLQLKTNQLDEVYAILTRQAEAHLFNEEPNLIWVLNDRAQFYDNPEAFRDVLTPAQFKCFKKLRDQQLPPDPSSFQKFLQGLGAAGVVSSLRGLH